MFQVTTRNLVFMTFHLVITQRWTMVTVLRALRNLIPMASVQEIGDQVEVEAESTPIQHLAAEISSNSFISINFVIDVSVHSIQIMELYNTIPGKTSVKFCVCINSELSASIFVHRQEIRRNHPCWDGMPLSFPSAKSVELLMRRLSTFSVCFGNPDEDLQTLASVDTEITTANSRHCCFSRGRLLCIKRECFIPLM